jgi:hypothetical protein
MQTACPKVGGVRQDNVYDVDVKVVLLPNLLDVDIFMALSLDYSWDGHQRRPRVTTYCQFMSIHSLRWICIICLFGVFFSIFWDVYGCVPHILGLFSICVWTSCVSQRSTVVLRTRTWETDNHVFAKLPIQGAIYCLWDKPGHPTGNLWRKHRKTIENIGKT